MYLLNMKLSRDGFQVIKYTYIDELIKVFLFIFISKSRCDQFSQAVNHSAAFFLFNLTVSWLFFFQLFLVTVFCHSYSTEILETTIIVQYAAKYCLKCSTSYRYVNFYSQSKAPCQVVYNLRRKKITITKRNSLTHNLVLLSLFFFIHSFQILMPDL